MISRIADWNFTPTDEAYSNLKNENIPVEKIQLTGNTIVDALKEIIQENQERMSSIIKKYDLQGKKYFYLTMHRRESWGKPMKSALSAIRTFLEVNQEYYAILPVHPNPIVKEIASTIFKDLRNIKLIPPVDYIESVTLTANASFVVTDSGGIIEESTTLCKPCLILREKIERPESVKFGNAKLIGTKEDIVFNELQNFIRNIVPQVEFNAFNFSNIYGDGQAAEKIVNRLETDYLMY